MLFDASKPLDIERAKARLDFLISKGKKFELVEKHPIRSLKQNNYLHLILSWFAHETGYTIEEVKQDIFKKIINPELFYEGEVGGLKVERWRSTADLSTLEMTTAIDKFRNFSVSELGIYLPAPDDLAMLQQMEDELKRMNVKVYL